MNHSSYFFPIKSTNIDFYFNAGIISPAIYIYDRSNDVQSGFPEAILLSLSKFTTDSNCSMEVFIDDQEHGHLEKIADGLFLFHKPLPISRVNAVFFESEEQKLRTIQGVINGSGFIPKFMCRVDNTTPLDLDRIDLKTSVFKKNDFNDQIKRFDRYLGGVAMLGTQKNEYGEYHLDFFKLLSHVNEVIKDEISVGLHLDEDDMNLPYAKVFFEIEKIGPLYQHLTEQKSVKEAEQYILADPSSGIKINENRNYNLKEINKVTPQLFVALFNSFGTYYKLNRKDTLDSFINQLNFGYIHKNLKSKANVIAFYFGMNKGYENFRNRYTINGEVIDFKFKLESKLDSYVIESIYNYSFYGKQSSSFRLIDRRFRSTDPAITDEYDYYTVFDQAFRISKKKRVADYFISLRDISKNPIYNEILKSITEEVSAVLPEFIPNKNSLINSRIRKRFEEFLNKYAEAMIDIVDVQIRHKTTKEKEALRKLTEENTVLARDLESMKEKESKLKTSENLISSDTIIPKVDFVDNDVPVESATEGSYNQKENEEKGTENPAQDSSGEVTHLESKKLVLENELDLITVEVERLLQESENNLRDIESAQSELEGFSGDLDDIEIQTGRDNRYKLELKKASFDKRIKKYDERNSILTKNLTEINEHLKRLLMVTSVKSSDSIAETNYNKIINQTNTQNTDIPQRENQQAFTLELTGPDDTLTLIDRYKTAFNAKKQDTFNKDELNEIAVAIGIAKPKPKNKPVLISLINTKLNLY